jgi:hypothetical protein
MSIDLLQNNKVILLISAFMILVIGLIYLYIKYVIYYKKEKKDYSGYFKSDFDTAMTYSDLSS